MDWCLLIAFLEMIILKQEVPCVPAVKLFDEILKKCQIIPEVELNLLSSLARRLLLQQFTRGHTLKTRPLKSCTLSLIMLRLMPRINCKCLTTGLFKMQLGSFYFPRLSY